MRSEEEIRDGQIKVDSRVGRRFGFISKRFRKDASWLWKQGNTIILSMVWVQEPNKGYTQQLIKDIRSDGYRVKVPTPLGAMVHIVEKMGFEQTEETTMAGPCEVWVLNDKGEK